MDKNKSGSALVEWMAALLLLTFGFFMALDAARLAFAQFDLEFRAGRLARAAEAATGSSADEWRAETIRSAREQAGNSVDVFVQVESRATVPETDPRRAPKRADILNLRLEKTLRPIFSAALVLPEWTLAAESRAFRAVEK